MERAEDAALSLAAAREGEMSTSICPSARARGRAEAAAAGPQRISSPIATSCHTLQLSHYTETEMRRTADIQQEKNTVHDKVRGTPVYPQFCVVKAFPPPVGCFSKLTVISSNLK